MQNNICGPFHTFLNSNLELYGFAVQYFAAEGNTKKKLIDIPKTAQSRMLTHMGAEQHRVII